MMEKDRDYSEYLIAGNKLIRGIGDNANNRNYKKAFELAYHLESLSAMLKEALHKQQNM